MSLTFSFRIDAAEHAKAGRAIAWRTLSYRVANIGLAAFAVTPTFLGLAIGKSLPRAIIDGLPLLIGVPLVFFIFFPWLQRRSVHRQLASAPALQHDQDYEFSDSGLRMSNPLAASEVRWDAILRVVETREFYLFYYAKAYAYYLPKRVLRNDSEALTLRSFLSDRMRTVGRPFTGLAA